MPSDDLRAAFTHRVSTPKASQKQGKSQRPLQDQETETETESRSKWGNTMSYEEFRAKIESRQSTTKKTSTMRLPSWAGKRNSTPSSGKHCCHYSYCFILV